MLFDRVCLRGLDVCGLRLEEVRRPATRREPEDRLADELRARTFDVIWDRTARFDEDSALSEKLRVILISLLATASKSRRCIPRQ